MAKKKLPPVPPASRSPKGPGGAEPDVPAADRPIKDSDSRHRDLSKQGRQGNIAVNTKNQGYQQDR
jgi:hypothetical protein